MQIVIAGHGGFAMEVAGWLTKHKIIVSRFIVDGDKNEIDDYKPSEREEVVVAIADPFVREDVAVRLSKKPGIRFHNIHMMTKNLNVETGIGNIWCPTSLVSSGARIGNFVQVNVMSSIGHDTVVGDFCTFSSHVDICGGVKIGARCFFGSGSRVLPRVKVGANCTIGAGCLVVKDLPDNAGVYTAPARRLK